MSNSKGAILRVLIVVGIIVSLWIGATFYLREIERREVEEIKETIMEWREKPAEERGDIIRKKLLILTEHKSKDVPELEKRLERVNLDPQKTETWIQELQFKFFLMAKETTEREIRECCEKELEKYLKILGARKGEII